MKNMLITCSIVVLLAAGACTTSGTDNPPVPTSSERFTTAFNGGDAASLAALYTEDGMLLPPNAKPVNGRQNIQDLARGLRCWSYWHRDRNRGVRGKRRHCL